MRHALIAIANNENNEPYSGQFAREILQTVNTSEEDATLVSRLRDYALRLSSETSAYSFMSDDLKKSADELETVRERFRERGQEISALVLELRRVIDEKNSR
jgi:hypothetical protein